MYVLEDLELDVSGLGRENVLHVRDHVGPHHKLRIPDEVMAWVGIRKNYEIFMEDFIQPVANTNTLN